jgi:hypothetical protein
MKRARELDLSTSGVEETGMGIPRSIRPIVALASAAALVASPTPSAAHFGHDLDSTAVGLTHFLLDLSHAGSGLIALFAFAVVMTAVHRARRRR